MKIRNVSWTISKLVALQDKIEDQPLYQRGEVWTLENRQLLIDTVLRGYDIPKLYLRALPGNEMYDFQVVDGQQRLNSVWLFAKDKKIALPSASIDPRPWAGLNYDQLSSVHRKKFNKFRVVIALIEGASEDAVRDLFARLQRGSTLNQAEIRNSLRSVVGAEIRAQALTHPFFTESRGNRSMCPFAPKRYKHHDLAAHAYALALHGLTRDLKAANLRQVYVDYGTAIPDGLSAKVSDTLTYMLEMQRVSPGLISRKWGFVDIYQLVTSTKKLPHADRLAERYLAFEQKRLRFVKKPSALLQATGRDRDLYDYIVAFSISGGVASNLRTRNDVISKKLLK